MIKLFFSPLNKKAYPFVCAFHILPATERSARLHTINWRRKFNQHQKSLFDAIGNKYKWWMLRFGPT